MSDTLPSDADLDTFAASLQADERDSTVFFRVLCAKLLDALPESTEVEREHSLLKKRRLARKVTVRLRDETFEATLGQGDVICRQIHSVTGVGGGLPWAKQLSVDEWLRALMATVAEQGQTSAAAASALRSLVT